MKRYGLIGKPVAHSFSQQFFRTKFACEGIGDADYGLYELDSLAGFRQWVEEEGLDGFNVTMPYKEAVMDSLDGLTPVAAAVGAVNCVAVCGGRLVGHNTDAPAFSSVIQPYLHPWHTSALVLGTGGASKAVKAAFDRLGIGAALVSRHPSAIGQISYAEAREEAVRSRVIVNATPVGMSPHTDSTPWPFPEVLTPKHLCFDLIYNPLHTRFLQEASARGAAVCNGLSMLHRQAQLSWEFWTDGEAGAQASNP